VRYICNIWQQKNKIKKARWTLLAEALPPNAEARRDALSPGAYQ
jgi:hypothetical protein